MTHTLSQRLLTPAVQHAANILAALALLTITGCETQPSAAKMMKQEIEREQERQRAMLAPTPFPPEILAAQKRLAGDYLAIMQASYPSYNGIRIEWQVFPNGLMASHPLFTDYEFDAGPLAGTIREWIAANRTELQAAGIHHVGIFRDWDHQHWFNTAVLSQ